MKNLSIEALVWIKYHFVPTCVFTLACYLSLHRDAFLYCFSSGAEKRVLSFTLQKLQTRMAFIVFSESGVSRELCLSKKAYPWLSNFPDIKAARKD